MEVVTHHQVVGVEAVAQEVEEVEVAEVAVAGEVQEVVGAEVVVGVVYSDFTHT